LSLQFQPATGYFSMVPARAFRWTLLAALIGCGQRDRLTFPTENPGNGQGPFTQIIEPGADTTVIEGDLLILRGRTYDPDGVDTVYIEIGGLNQGFPPIIGGGADTVNFALQLSTLNHSGGTALVRVHGVDRLGDQGSPVTRQIRIE
jgi:hypothetical protein